MEAPLISLEYALEELILEMYRVALFLYLKPLEISFFTIFLYHGLLVGIVYFIVKHIHCMEDRKYFQRIIDESVQHHTHHIKVEFQQLLNSKENRSIWPIYLQSVKRLHLLSALLKRSHEEIEFLKKSHSVIKQ